jgi:Xaa-Pro aminopeptidase
VFTSASESEHRIERMLQRLEQEQLDGALLHGVTSTLYFAGTAQQAHLWIPTFGPPRLLVRRVVERARRESPLHSIEPLASLKLLGEALGPVRRIGMELDILPVTAFERYRKIFGDIEIVDVGPITRQIRAQKSSEEIDRVRAAAVAADRTFADAIATLRAGMRELDLSIAFETAQRRHGAQGMLRWRAASGFECPWAHVLAGDSALQMTFTDTPFGGPGLTAAAPYGASRRPIERHEPVCIDLAMPVDGYIHDMTRTVAIGGLDSDLMAGYDVCRAIHAELAEAAQPGASGETLWERAVAVADDAGLADRFMGTDEGRVRFVGHGVGLELDELPVLAPRQSTPLELGNVIAIEPKLFYPGRGAVGLESTYVVTESGLERLTVTSDDLVILADQ